MVARIFQPAKTAMQSGKLKTQTWVIEHEPSTAKTIDPLMGYASSTDMLSQVRLSFQSREDAVAYAERNDIEYRVIEPKIPKRRPASYTDNFRYDRKIPWTH